METEKQKKYREYAEKAFWTGHYHYMMQALAVAMSHTMVWRLVGNGTAFTLKELFEFAKSEDVKHELTGTQFYMVSREGAIGLSPGLEYLTQWIFVPMEPCEQRDALEKQMREYIEEEEAIEKAIEQAVTEGLAREEAEKQARAAAEQAKQEAAIPEIPSIPQSQPAPQDAGVEVVQQSMPQAAPQLPAKYYMAYNNESYGPYTLPQLLQYQIDPDTPIWIDGRNEWIPAAQVSEIASALGFTYQY